MHSSRFGKTIPFADILMDRQDAIGDGQVVTAESKERNLALGYVEITRERGTDREFLA